jgi:hypothetical protein|tara:strand:- start:2161 stop:2355 length:195 start_codon:yes stop_codon:yes gene_type:complete
MRDMRSQFSSAPKAGGGFNPYAAGKKHYGSGRPMPTVGRVSDRAGYNERDVKAAARRDALMRRI